MPVYKILSNGNAILRAKAAPVKKINSGVLRLLDNMCDTMYANDGLGLAAPQIGVSKRIIVVDVNDHLLELINPEIIDKQGEQIKVEGCLSVPDMMGPVKRAYKIIVKGWDRKGEEIEIEAEEMMARALQHEIDHLDGILFIDIALETRSLKE